METGHNPGDTLDMFPTGSQLEWQISETVHPRVN